MLRFAALIVLMFAPACQFERSLNPALNPDDLYGPVTQPADLPVPLDMRLVVGANRSRSYQRGSFRTAFLVYEGPATIADVQGFVKQRFPTHGWEMIQEEAKGSERLLQRWIDKTDEHVHYLADVEIVNAGGQRRVTYDLRTRRATDTSKQGS